MTYFTSDIHGEYDLFCKLLKAISFSEHDEMYICGDIIDKGKQSIRLAKLIFSMPNVHVIRGNHEHYFLMYYDSLMKKATDDFDEVLKHLQDYFPNEDDDLLDWDTVDKLESLPSYIEKEQFICVHAGVPINQDGTLVPLESAFIGALLNDRRFKDKDCFHISPKCVFFGHTTTDCVCGEAKVLAYPRKSFNGREIHISDFYKIHLDTGTNANGVLGCFCLETCKVIYAKKQTKGI